MSRLRLRVKVWTNPKNGNLYMVSNAFGQMRKNDIIMTAYAMRDDETLMVEFTVDEWNALDYKYFLEDGDAPRPEKKWNPDLPDGLGGGPIVH